MGESHIYCKKSRELPYKPDSSTTEELDCNKFAKFWDNGGHVHGEMTILFYATILFILRIQDFLAFYCNMIGWCN